KLIRKPNSFVHNRLSLLPKLPSKASTNLGAPQNAVQFEKETFHATRQRTRPSKPFLDRIHESRPPFARQKSRCISDPFFALRHKLAKFKFFSWYVADIGAGNVLFVKHETILL
ncbi:hypothetical protein, partial [Celeribacter halophilus]|uniref:hypothetical protein n=1 Tax=Celeribacter halophilus TaxID=576117 RepID=UPI002FD1440A